MYFLVTLLLFGIYVIMTSNQQFKIKEVIIDFQFAARSTKCQRRAKNRVCGPKSFDLYNQELTELLLDS